MKLELAPPILWPMGLSLLSRLRGMAQGLWERAIFVEPPTLAQSVEQMLALADRYDSNQPGLAADLRMAAQRAVEGASSDR